MMAKKRIHIHLHDAEFEENKHPRAENGQFGKGGGGKKAGSSKTAGPVSVGNIGHGSSHQFVQEFTRNYPTGAARKEQLKKTPSDMLRKASEALKSAEDPQSKGVKELVDAEIARRSGSSSETWGKDPSSMSPKEAYAEIKHALSLPSPKSEQEGKTRVERLKALAKAHPDAAKRAWSEVPGSNAKK